MAEANAYVQKEVFDARMDRMEMLLEKTVLEIKSYTEKTTAETRAYLEKTTVETKAEIAEIRKEIRVINTRIDSLENVLFWGFSGLGIIIGLAVFAPAVAGAMKKIFQPSLTVDDVKKIFLEMSSGNLKGGQAE